MCTALLSIPLTLSYLGDERYGLWIVTLTSFSFVHFLDGGLMPTIKNRMAEAYGKNRPKTFEYYSSGALLVGFCILGIGVFIGWLLPYFDWSTIFKVHDETAKREALPLVRVVFFVGLGTVALGAVDAIYAAQMKINKMQCYSIIASLAGFSMLILGIQARVSLPILAMLVSCPLVVSKIILLLELYIVKRQFTVPQFSRFPAFLRDCLSSSTAFVGIKAAELVISILPNIIIVKVLSLSDATTYGIAQRFVTVPLIFVTAVLPVIWPVFTIAWSRNEKSWLRKRLAMFTVTTAFALIIFTVVITAIGPTLIAWWTQNQAKVSSGIIAGLGILITVQAATYWLSTFLHSISDFRFEFICHLSSAILLTVTGWTMTRHWGMFGLTMAIAISWTVGCLAPMTIRARSKLC